MATLMFEQVNGVDLDRLNEAERQVLLLLAEGHTAKSVANELASTPAAVNERLREARRKTGVGSSRELARLLKSQENRHDEMGVVERPQSTSSVSHSAAEPWRPQRGVLVMMILLIGAIGAAAFFGSASGAGDQAVPVVDPLIGTIPSSENAPDKLHARVRAEPKDAAWANKAEMVLRDRYLKIPHVGTPNAPLRIMCSTTVCEVAGTIDAPQPPDDSFDPKYPMNAAMRGLQDHSLSNDLKLAGLEGVGAMLSGNAKKQATFVAYYIRAKP